MRGLRHHVGMGESRLDELAGASPDLRVVLDELRGSGLRVWAGPDPLLHAEVTAEHLSEFLSLLVREVPDEQLYGLAQVLPACVFRRGAGHEALEHVLTGGRLSAVQRELLRDQGIRLVAEGDLPLVLRHRAVAELTVGLVSPRVYATFLRKHAAELALVAPGELGLVVLDPRIEPDLEAFECLEPLILHAPDPEPFVRRACDWILAGTFDSGSQQDRTDVDLAYRLLEDRWEDRRFDPIRRTMFEHLVDLIRAPEDLVKAWHHLNALVGRSDRLEQACLDRLAAARIRVTPYQRAALVPLLELFLRSGAGDLQQYEEYREQRDRIRSAGPPLDRPEGDELERPGDPVGYLLPPGR